MIQFTAFQDACHWLKSEIYRVLEVAPHDKMPFIEYFIIIYLLIFIIIYVKHLLSNRSKNQED